MMTILSLNKIVTIYNGNVTVQKISESLLHKAEDCLNFQIGDEIKNKHFEHHWEKESERDPWTIK
jgi:hypothetical protein